MASFLTLSSSPQGLIIGTEHGVDCVQKTITSYLLEDFLTEDHDRQILYCHGGTKHEYGMIDYKALLEKGWSVFPIMGLNDIKALKISRPLPGKEKSKKSEDKHIYYLRDSELLSGLKEVEFRQAYPGRTLHESISFFADLVEQNFDVSIHKAPTLAGLSMGAFKKHVKAQEFEMEGLSGRFRTAVEDSYFGGHTYCFNVRPHEREVGIDANSHYASVMRKYDLPDGSPTFRFGDDWEEDDLVLASVEIPSGSFPFLKSRQGVYSLDHIVPDIKKIGTGRISGWFWGFELLFQKKHGGVIYADEYIRWPKRTNILKAHIEKCRTLRNLDKKSPLGQTVKLFQNSLYGKFAQRPSETEMIISLSDPGGGAWQRALPGSVSPVVRDWLWERPSPYRWSGQDMIHWGSYITARARFDHASAIDLIGWQNVDYADNDSIFCEEVHLAGKIETLYGEDYGQWKLLGLYKSWQASAPKCYQWSDDKHGIDRKHAGIPQDQARGVISGKVRVEKKTSLRTIIAQAKSAESHYRMISMSDPKLGGKYDRLGNWIPDHIDQCLMDFNGRRKLSGHERTHLSILMQERPDLFARLPIPDHSALGKWGEIPEDEAIKEKVERIMEKKIEWMDKHRGTGYPDHQEDIDTETHSILQIW